MVTTAPATVKTGPEPVPCLMWQYLIFGEQRPNVVSFCEAITEKLSYSFHLGQIRMIGQIYACLSLITVNMYDTKSDISVLPCMLP